MIIPNELFREDKGVGYIYAYFPNHPLANKAGKVYEHRYVAWLHNGKHLPEDCHVHHKDGDKTNNRVDNLEILSAAEHVRKHLGEKEVFKANCSYCGSELFIEKLRKLKSKSGDIYCNSECNNRHKRLFEVDREILRTLIWAFPATKVAKLFKVSDKAIEKRCKLLGVPKPPRGYWAKKRSTNASRSPQGSSKPSA